MTVLKEFAKLAMGEGCRAGKEEKKVRQKLRKRVCGWSPARLSVVRLVYPHAKPYVGTSPYLLYR